MSTDESLIKAEKDYSQTLDVELPEIEKLQITDGEAALDRLLALEKKVRQASDLPSSQRVLTEIVRLLRSKNQWSRLNETVQVLSKKHGQLKTAIQTLVQEVIAGLDQAPDLKTKITCIENLREISEGKIYLELERARITRTLAHIRKEQGDVKAAENLMGELQIETLGAMDLREKTDYILEHMELCIDAGDIQLANIVSRKIMPKTLQGEKVQDQKLRYYELCVQIALKDNKYHDVFVDYRHIYDTPSVQDDEAKATDILRNLVVFAVLAPFEGHSGDLLRLHKDPLLQALPLYEHFVRMFTLDELIRWPKVEKVYGEGLKSMWVFQGKDGDKHWSDLRSRVIEHNIRVIAKFYTRISISGLSELLDLDAAEAEQVLAKLVVEKIVYARIDRPKQIISFVREKPIAEALNDWSNNTEKLLGHIETLGHLIAKEEMMHGIDQAQKA